MKGFLALLAAALLLLSSALQVKAQQIPVNEESPVVTVELHYHGEIPIELFWQPSASEEVFPLDIKLLALQTITLDLEPGDSLFLAEYNAEPTGDTNEPAFYAITVGNEAPDEPIIIPDPRDTRLVQLKIPNPLNETIIVSTFSGDESGETAELSRAAAGETSAFEIFPGTVVIVESESSNLVTNFIVSREPIQNFDLNSIINPTGEKALVAIMNGSDRPIAIEENLPGSIVRIAVIEPGKEAEVVATIDATLKLLTNDEPLEELGRFDVTDSSEQRILVSSSGAENVIIPVPPRIDLALIPERFRSNAVNFLNTISETEKRNENITGYIVYNNSDKPVWLAGLDGENLIGAKQVKPKFTGNIIAPKGKFSIVWPGDISPENVVREDVYRSILVEDGMPKIIEISPPNEIKLSLTNAMCKPLDIFRVDAFGEETLVAQLAPLEKSNNVFRQNASDTLVARGGQDSLRKGELLWTNQLGGTGQQDLLISAALSTFDAMLSSQVAPDTIPSTVRFTNKTNRAIELYTIDDTGAERLVDGGVINIEETVGFPITAGTVVVFRRPNTSPETGEYARYRVSAERTQDIEIGDLRNKSGLNGVWIDLARPALSEDNDVGTNFLTFVKQKGLILKGSSNLGDSIHSGAARYEGCMDKEEAFGRWYPSNPDWICVGGNVKDTNDIEQQSWGQFSARRVAHANAPSTLKLDRNICNGGATASTKWYQLPTHYDDMKPSKEALQTGEFKLEWAPKSFDWLGRGYDLLRTDPLEYGSTKLGPKNNAKIYSDKPLFDFIYEDVAGRAIEHNAKKIFGVSNVNQTGSSAECEVNEELIRTYEDLRDFASKSYSGSVGVPQVSSFSLSKSHEKVNTASTGRDRAFIMERCDHRLHVLKTNLRWPDRGGYDNLRQPLEIGFRQSVEQLPLEFGDGKDILRFIQKYGTHFSERIVYGGTFFAETEISKETYQVGKTENNTMSLEADGTLKKVNLGGTYKEEESSGRNGENSHSGSHYRKWSIGGVGGSVYSDWAPTVANTPVPIDVSFRPIYDIVTPIFFPDDPNIGVKNDLLRNATELYFNQFGHSSLTSDPRQLDIIDPRSICVNMDNFEFTFTGAEGHTYGGALFGGFLDSKKNPVDSANFTLGGNVKTDVKSRKDGLAVWARDAGGFAGHPPHCTDIIDDNYIRSGSLYMHGKFYVDDGVGGQANFSQGFPEAREIFSLARLEVGDKKIVKGQFVLPSGTAKYQISIWVNEQ